MTVNHSPRKTRATPAMRPGADAGMNHSPLSDLSHGLLAKSPRYWLNTSIGLIGPPCVNDKNEIIIAYFCSHGGVRTYGGGL